MDLQFGTTQKGKPKLIATKLDEMQMRPNRMRRKWMRIFYVQCFVAKLEPRRFSIDLAIRSVVSLTDWLRVMQTDRC